jgi:hypothetical protein
MCLKKPPKCFSREASLLDDRFQRPALEVLTMEGERDAEMGFVRMFENMMAACRVVNKKPGPLQGPEDLSWPERGEVWAHTGWSTTFTSSFTGSSRIALSGGMGWPSFCKLSK